jgi:aldehyde dehydrogenase (NAD+)
LKAVSEEAVETLLALGVDRAEFSEGSLLVYSPISGDLIGRLRPTSSQSAAETIERAHSAFLKWRKIPAPRRGEFVRLFADELRANKTALGRLVTLEAGKILSEGQGEVQEMIDICVFAAGLSRQLYGLTIATERSQHRMMETWHPLGVTGIISAFNFPVAVWCWNAALALVCGNSVVWKPSEKTPLCALATQALFARAAARCEGAPEDLSQILIGGAEIGQLLVEDDRVPLVSATGSTAMGRRVAPPLANRFGRAILELGGNNGAIICPSADLDLALRAVAFSAMGTAGQRCTTLRRVFVHESIYDNFVGRLRSVFESVTVGNPLDPGTLVGPLIDERSFQAMENTLRELATCNCSRITGGGRVPIANHSRAFYVRPALVEIPHQNDAVRRETFAPITYVLKYSSLEQAIRFHNDVPQGLASSIFTNDIREAELFLSAEGSDCGIVNVNIGPSGAEIGGAFGGEKETGGGRESGSDVWKSYMRRATNTINYGNELPLAQGVKFDVI